MSERTTYNAEIERRQEYTRRIVKAVNYKGNADHEDVPSILQKFQEEIIKEHADKVVEQLIANSSIVEDGDGCARHFIFTSKAIEIVKKGGTE